MYQGLFHIDLLFHCLFSNPLFYLLDLFYVVNAVKGGPMSAEEADKFDADPLKQTILLMRTWDDKATNFHLYFTEAERNPHAIEFYRPRLLGSRFRR